MLDQGIHVRELVHLRGRVVRGDEHTLDLATAGRTVTVELAPDLRGPASAAAGSEIEVWGTLVEDALEESAGTRGTAQRVPTRIHALASAYPDARSGPEAPTRWFHPLLALAVIASVALGALPLGIPYAQFFAALVVSAIACVAYPPAWPRHIALVMVALHIVLARLPYYDAYKGWNNASPAVFAMLAIQPAVITSALRLFALRRRRLRWARGIVLATEGSRTTIAVDTSERSFASELLGLGPVANSQRVFIGPDRIVTTIAQEHTQRLRHAVMLALALPAAAVLALTTYRMVG